MRTKNLWTKRTNVTEQVTWFNNGNAFKQTGPNQKQQESYLDYNN